MPQVTATNEARLMDLGVALLNLNLKANELELHKLQVKDEIYSILSKEGAAVIEIASNDGNHVFVFKNNVRTSRAFDKDGLASELDVSRDDLGYDGVADLVEREVASARIVGKFVSENRSQFVTVRKRKARAGGKRNNGR